MSLPFPNLLSAYMPYILLKILLFYLCCLVSMIPSIVKYNIRRDASIYKLHVYNMHNIYLYQANYPLKRKKFFNTKHSLLFWVEKNMLKRKCTLWLVCVEQ
jgi:hypothetical protein